MPDILKAFCLNQRTGRKGRDIGNSTNWRLVKMVRDIQEMVAQVCYLDGRGDLGSRNDRNNRTITEMPLQSYAVSQPIQHVDGGDRLKLTPGKCCRCQESREECWERKSTINVTACKPKAQVRDQIRGIK